jgi:hypothetical protein
MSHFFFHHLYSSNTYFNQFTRIIHVHFLKNLLKAEFNRLLLYIVRHWSVFASLKSFVPYTICISICLSHLTFGAFEYGLPVI